MIADALIVPIRFNEQMPLFGYAQAPAGKTTTISAATCSLYAVSEAGVVGTASFEDGAVTGYDQTAVRQGRAWYVVKPSVLALSEGGWYRLIFKITHTGSDSIARVSEPFVDFYVDKANT